MPRPRLRRRVRHSPAVYFFKPQGIRLRDLEMVEITKEELEAIKLKDVLELNQIEVAKKMNTSQSTLQRILSSARQKISKAIVKGWAIRIEE